MKKEENNIEIEEIKEEVLNYLKEKINITQLSAIEVTAKLTGIAAAVIIVATLLMFFILLASLLAASFLGNILDSSFLGYTIVASFYLVILVLCATVFWKKVTRFITNKVIYIISTTLNSASNE